MSQMGPAILASKVHISWKLRREIVEIKTIHNAIIMYRFQLFIYLRHMALQNDNKRTTFGQLLEKVATFWATFQNFEQLFEKRRVTCGQGYQKF